MKRLHFHPVQLAHSDPPLHPLYKDLRCIDQHQFFEMPSWKCFLPCFIYLLIKNTPTFRLTCTKHFSYLIIITIIIILLSSGMMTQSGHKTYSSFVIPWQKCFCKFCKILSDCYYYHMMVLQQICHKMYFKFA